MKAFEQYLKLSIKLRHEGSNPMMIHTLRREVAGECIWIFTSCTFYHPTAAKHASRPSTMEYDAQFPIESSMFSQHLTALRIAGVFMTYLKHERSAKNMSLGHQGPLKWQCHRTTQGLTRSSVVTSWATVRWVWVQIMDGAELCPSFSKPPSNNSRFLIAKIWLV